MRESTLVRAIMTTASILILIGVVLMTYMLLTADSRNVIKIDLEIDSTESIGFSGLKLVPGDYREYDIQLKSDSSQSCTLRMDFVELEEKTLKNYVRVKVLSGDTVICDELLADAFENDAIVLPVDFGSKKNTELKIVYYMPLEVGNGAKNAEAVFEVRFTASNE